MGAVGRREERPVDGVRGADLEWAGTVVVPFPAVLAVKAGFRMPDGTAPGCLATGFGSPWTSLDTPGCVGGGLKDGIIAGS